MTSIEFFPLPPKQPIHPVLKEWGTGKLKKDFDLWLKKSSTWHLSGEPVKSYYALTKLRLSNVRLNDQLLTNPEHSNMSGIMINQRFPAEHPYSSHMSKFAVLPTFDSAQDPKSGVAARDVMPKGDEMPSNPWDVLVVRKVKGHPYRHEVQALLPESLKKPLLWKPGDECDQNVKSPWSDRQTFYPTSTKTYYASMPERDDAKCIVGNMVINQPTANALKNVERNLKDTTYNRTFTGMGSTNPMALDNYDDKQHKKIMTGFLDDKLYPRSINTFDPARKADGRMEAIVTPLPPLLGDIHNHPEPEKTLGRKMTPKEQAEHVLWFGKKYASLPEGYGERCVADHPGVPVNTNPGTQAEADAQADRHAYPYAARPLPEPVSIMDTLVPQQHERLQQWEAENRWKLLDLQTASHDIAALRRKLDLTASIKEHPKVFSNHEGKYQRERAGMYMTSYDPDKLRGMMHHERRRGPELMYTADSNQGALNLKTELNRSMAEATRYNRTLGGPPGSVPQLNQQVAPHELVMPRNEAVEWQREELLPTVMTSDIRTQDGRIISKESEYADQYNTKTFLQENQLAPKARNEPLVVMSIENQNLAGVKPTTYSRACCPTAVPVPEPGPTQNDYINRLVSRPYTAPDEMLVYQPPEEQDLSAPATQRGDMTQRGGPSQVTTTRGAPADPTMTYPVPLMPHRPPTLTNLPRHFTLVRPKYSVLTPGRKSDNPDWKYGIYNFDYSPKDGDARFDWHAGSGLPPPSTSIQRIVDGFSKTEAHRQFHDRFDEIGPDLRENIVTGKKHIFNGLHQMILR